MSDSSLLELLSVTDKAVKALNKSHSMHSEHSLESSVESTVSQSSADHGIKSQIEHKKQEPICYQSDVSTTASDVLIRSTLIDDEGKQHLSSSLVAVRGEKNESKCSKTSIGIDNFNSSGPQKVKMSTKKLREIRSPRDEEPHILFSNILSQTVNSLSNECLESYSEVKTKPYVTRHFREVNSQLQKPIKDCSEKSPPNLDIILHNDSPVTSNETTQFEYENSTLPSSRNSSKDSEVLIERHTPKVTRATKNYPAGNKESLQMRPKQMESKDSLDLIPHKEIESGNCSLSNSEKLEIITVPERIVTVSARTSLSTEISYKEKEDMMIPPRLSSDLQPAKKLSNHLIRQGAPVEGMELQDRKKLSSDVQISQSTVFDRQKIKEALTKRHENSGPVKRVIQPKFVKPKGTDSSETNKSDQMTASVAASVAMAATAPFLQAQQELENRMKDMLAKISEIQNGKKVNTSVEDDRVKKLERQVTSLTEQRIQHLEKLQEHQAELQAKILMMTRSNRSPPPETPVIYRQQGISSFKPKKDSDKSSSRPKSTSPARRPKTTSLSRSNLSKGMTEDPCESPFDTPNPRSKAPKPVAFNTSRMKTQDKNNHTNMGILEEILASSESPRQTFASPQLPVLQSDIDEPLCKSPELRKAEKLVGDLSGINDDVKSLVHEVDRCKLLEDRKKKIDKEKDLLLGPSPLDLYLITSSGKNFSTPYKSVPELSYHQFNAPLPPGFNEAEHVLQDVSKARNCLEANLQSVLRSQQENEVYAILENLHQNRSDPGRAHLQQKIDKWVTKLRQQVESEITDDVVVAELQKAHLPVYKIPPPKVISTQIIQGKDKFGMTRPILGQAKHGARINLGRRQPGKENKQDLVKPIKKDSRNLNEDEDFMNRVYGKTRFQGKRTIAKDPYLHFKTETKQKVEHPKGITYTKGHTVRSTKSQTSVGIKQFYFNPTHGTYIPVNTNDTSGPTPGSLIQMAIPLGEPRMEGGLTAPVTMTTQRGPITSTPVSKIPVTAEKNYALITVPAENVNIQKRAQELAKQVLPNVDIDTDLSEMSDKYMNKKSVLSSSRSEQSKCRPPSPTRSEKQKDLTYKRSEHSLERSNHIQSLHYSPKDEYQDTTNKVDAELTEVVYDDDFSPESAPGIELPGYNVPSPPTPRQSFPPDIPGQNRVIAVSDQIAEDIKRQEALENKAVEWVEQELMAKVISKMSTNRTIEPPHISHFVEEVEESVCSDHENSMFLMEALGHNGLQLFIDAGQPVDMSLVNSLVKECVLEKVFSMLGKKSDDLQTGMAHTEMRISTGSSTEHGQIRDLQKDEFDNRHVITPKPTPKSSPIMSPVQTKLPPLTPPNSPPIGKEIYDIQKFEVIKPEYESELSESIDISEEMRQLQGKLSIPEEKVMTQEIHTVITPVTTPVPEEDTFKEQRSVSPQPLTPSNERKEIVIPTIQAQGTEVSDESTQMPETAAVIKESAVETVLPEPWGDPYLPIPEENPDFEIEFLDHPVPITLCAAPADDMVATQSLISLPRSGSPKTITPDGQSSPVSSDDSTTLQSSVSDTFNQSVSMGQWLLSKSEGEVADYILNDDLRQRIAKSSKNRGDCSIADTLKDTTELVDESMEPFSEGEFQYRTDLSPEKDPLLNFIASLQKTPLQGQFAMPADHVHQVLNQSGKSIGEVTMVGQSGDQLSRDQFNISPIYNDQHSRISTFDLDQKNQSLEKGGKNRDGNRSPTQILKRNGYSPTKEKSHDIYHSNGFLNQDISMQDSAVINDQKRSSVEFNDKPEILSGRKQQDKHHIPSGGITVTQGGLMPGGRSALKSAMRKPPQIKKSVEQPERSVGMNQYHAINVRSSDMKDSYEGSQDQLSSRAYTPDQMRLDTLVQSGYLTYSGELIRSGQSIDRSTYRDSSEYRYMNPSRTERSQSLGLTYSFEEEDDYNEREDDYKKSDNFEEPVKLKMSVTLPTTEDSNDGSQLSEIDITDRNTK